MGIFVLQVYICRTIIAVSVLFISKPLQVILSYNQSEILTPFSKELTISFYFEEVLSKKDTESK